MSVPAPRLRDLNLFVPGEIDDYPFLPLEFRLLCRVSRRGGGGCYDSLATLANAFRVSQRTITRTFRVLTFCGAVVRLDHPARYEPRPFSEWVSAADLDKIRGEVWGKTPRRRTRRRHSLALVSTNGILSAGEKSNRPRCLDRPSRVSQSAQTPGTDEGDPISEGKSLKSVETHTPVVENSFEQKPTARRHDPEVIRLYRRFCRQAPNYYQRREIIAKVTDAETWEVVLRQFMLEGQNPHRIDWLFERYSRIVEGDEIDEAPLVVNESSRIGAHHFPVREAIAIGQPIRTLKEQIESGEFVAAKRGFTNKEFLEAWDVFAQWRAGRGNPLTPRSVENVAAGLAKLTEREAIAALRFLLPRGWEGETQTADEKSTSVCVGCDGPIICGQQFARRRSERAHVGCLGLVAEVAECHA